MPNQLGFPIDHIGNQIGYDTNTNDKVGGSQASGYIVAPQQIGSTETTAQASEQSSIEKKSDINI